MELIMIESRMVPPAERQHSNQADGERQHSNQADGELPQPQVGYPVPMHAISCMTCTKEQWHTQSFC